MPSFPGPLPVRIRAIIFDMDNTLFDFVAAKQHACREVAKFIGRDDWEALFSCFLDSPHGFESHENIRDYFDLCGLLEACSNRRETGEPGEKSGNLPDTPIASRQDIGADNPLPERENVVRIQVSQVTQSPAKDSHPENTVPGPQAGARRVSVPSACAIPPVSPTTLSKEQTDAGSSGPKGGGPASQPPSKPVRDNLLADKSLYCNEVFSRCCAIYEAEKVRVLTPYPGARETLGELKRRGFPLAVVTDAHKENALARLRKAGLEAFFDYVISFDMTGAKKPAPDAFLLALKKLGTKPEETLLVGDSIRRDIAPALQLGMITAYAKYGDRNIRGRDPPDCRPDYVLGDISELVGILLNMMSTN